MSTRGLFNIGMQTLRKFQHNKLKTKEFRIHPLKTCKLMRLWSDKWNMNMLIIQIKKSNLEIKSALRYLTTRLIIGHQFLLIEDLKIYKLHKTYRYLLLSLIMRKTKKEKICLQKIKVRVYKLEKVVIQKYVVQVQTIKVALSLKYKI